VRELLESLVDACRPHAAALGCSAALERTLRLAGEGGAERQRAIAAGTGTLERVVARLADQFLPDPPLPDTSD
jgi:glutamate---cysteine ligase / carboxylate-amine ligase